MFAFFKNIQIGKYKPIKPDWLKRFFGYGANFCEQFIDNGDFQDNLEGSPKFFKRWRNDQLVNSLAYPLCWNSDQLRWELDKTCGGIPNGFVPPVANKSGFWEGNVAAGLSHTVLIYSGQGVVNDVFLWSSLGTMALVVIADGVSLEHPRPSNYSGMADGYTRNEFGSHKTDGSNWQSSHALKVKHATSIQLDLKNLGGGASGPVRIWWSAYQY